VPWWVLDTYTILIVTSTFKKKTAVSSKRNYSPQLNGTLYKAMPMGVWANLSFDYLYNIQQLTIRLTNDSVTTSHTVVHQNLQMHLTRNIRLYHVTGHFTIPKTLRTCYLRCLGLFIPHSPFPGQSMPSTPPHFAFG